MQDDFVNVEERMMPAKETENLISPIGSLIFRHHPRAS